mmetsp:Transcript_45393/g.33177  ORF Transcript_45393/g.33177 Transcript_45393/m.33177 type:complete len:248 (+) Transcript_45393:1299-2042(+)
MILGIFAGGAKTELILNLLIFSDLSRWEQSRIRVFVNMIKDIVKQAHESNRILLCYNPILAICLSCEYLNKIGNQISIFKHENKETKEKLLQLGIKILENFEDDKIEKIFLDVDFKDRTVLKIITKNSFSELFFTYKVNILLEEIWQGKHTYDCDGNITDFSLINYLLVMPIKKLPGKKLTPRELLTNNFRVSIDNNKYWYQYKYRHQSISYIYLKDLFSATGMVILFFYINLQYLFLFKESNYDDF